MSIKTSLLKRIAQTAVVALFGGLLGTVATPAVNAASNPNASVSATCVMREGVGGFIKVTYAGAGTGSARVRALGTEFTAKNNNSYSLSAAFLANTISTGIINDSNTSTLILPLTGDSVTNVSVLKYNVWLDVNGTDTSTVSAASPSTAVTCNDGGPVASFTLSSTSATGVAGDTATFTVTPKGATYDTMLAHYLIEPEKRHGMDALALAYLSYEPMSIENLIGKKGAKQGNMREVELNLIKEYAAEDADITLQLKPFLDKQLKTNPKAVQLLNEVEMPLARVLSAIECEGVNLDVPFLQEMSKTLEADSKAVQEKIFATAGQDPLRQVCSITTQVAFLGALPIWLSIQL